MDIMHSFLVLLSLFALSSCYAIGRGEEDKKLVVCYWGSWSHYRPGDGRFSVENIDTSLCTHLVYGFAKLVDGVITAFDPWLDLDASSGGGLDMYRRFNSLKHKNPNLKTIIAIGGWNEGSTKYSQMASTAEGRQKFVHSVVEFLQRHGFDGLDMDWEYPTERGGQEWDQENFVLLLQELKAQLKPLNYLLTAAVSGGRPTIVRAYNVTEVVKCLDLMSVMGYDYFGAWAKTTGHNSPLRARDNATDLEKIFNVEASIDFWLSKGADRKKMTLGMPLYGRTFTLANPRQTGYMAPAIGPGQKGPFTGEAGFLGYNEICTMLSYLGWTITEDKKVAAPVAVKGTQWIAYDDKTSLTRKVLLAMSKGLAGVMVWSMETDDFRGNCGDGKNPLLSSIHSTLKVPTPPPERPARFTVQPVEFPTEEPGASTNDHRELLPKELQEVTQEHCKNQNYMPHPKDPKKFIQCVLQPNRKFTIHIFECAPGTVYNGTVNACVHDAILQQDQTMTSPASQLLDGLTDTYKPSSTDSPTTLATSGAPEFIQTEASSEVTLPTTLATANAPESVQTEASPEASPPSTLATARATEFVQTEASPEVTPPTTLATAKAPESVHTEASPEVTPRTTLATSKAPESVQTEASPEATPPTTLATSKAPVSVQTEASPEVTPPTTLATSKAPESVQTDASPKGNRNEDFRCPHEGIYAHLVDRKMFYMCVKGDSKDMYILYTTTCPPGTIFDAKHRRCEHDPSPFVGCVPGNGGYHESDLLQKCEESESFAYPDNPLKFYVCDKISEGRYRVHDFDCPDGTIFSNAKRHCVHVQSQEAGLSDGN